MAKLLFNVLKLSPIVVAATLFVSNGAFAAEEKVTSVDELAQVTSVSQLSDVQPSDWAFQSVQSLVERYGCIAGYPDGTFKGNRALTRYEFAAGLNACLERITQLIAAGTTVPEADTEAIDRLSEEFNDELIGIVDRINGLDARAAKIEANQFSTTAKLKGEALFAVSDSFGGQDGKDTNTVFTNRVRLGISSSFNGKDNLSLRLQARNTPSIKDGDTNMTRLGFDGVTTGGNNVEMDKLSYSFKPSDKLSVKVDAVGAAMEDNVNNYNPVFASSGGGAISRYGRFNPIYRVAGGQSAVTVNYGKSNSALRLNAGYVASNASDTTKGGIFEGDETFFGQVDLKPTKKLNVGVAYARANRSGGTGLLGSTGSSFANDPFGKQATTANVYSLLANYQLNKKTTLAGWYGFVDADQKNSTNSADINYWAASLGVKDFGAKGNTLGLIFGQPPKVTNNSLATREDNGTSYHLEGLYKMRVNDRIDVTPGLLVIFNPEHNSARDTVYVGTLRTTFKF
ncbi:MAG: iron uptake porin [Richelia sp. RM2_1_2]|nr:iron uptake porin [Richelia sp. SM1_7_0]NJO62066.1 iron uptake porin [Richelia sp. RM2_1_2]